MDKRNILEEIKRTAKANGDRPLGKERFYKETGIKESDWLGKHWVRWNDALREGGFEPNRMQRALDENDLIEKFVGLMRELGNFPTKYEVKLKARRTPGFPAYNTFTTRFGSKHKLAASIRSIAKNEQATMTFRLCVLRLRSLIHFHLMTMSSRKRVGGSCT